RPVGRAGVLRPRPRPVGTQRSRGTGRPVAGRPAEQTDRRINLALVGSGPVPGRPVLGGAGNPGGGQPPAARRRGDCGTAPRLGKGGERAMTSTQMGPLAVRLDRVQPLSYSDNPARPLTDGVCAERGTALRRRRRSWRRTSL